tara:strand:- start:55 stop:495 length:441 start_codon:yes stop_codon:yes gene_type:complete
MKYLPQNKLPQWRMDNEPVLCPLLNCKNDNWVVDHCHNTGMVRGVVSSEGNVLLGKIENAYKRLSKDAKYCSLPTVLRSMAIYLENKSTGILHPEGYRQLYKRFSRLSKDLQLDILMKVGIKRDLIQQCKNAKDRTKLYKQYLKDE